jgi:hypothetical protein
VVVTIGIFEDFEEWSEDDKELRIGNQLDGSCKYI